MNITVEERFPQFDDMMEAVDKVDSGNLTIDEVQNPKGWILIGFPHGSENRTWKIQKLYNF